MKKRHRGLGSIYKPKNSRFLWISYSINGRRHRESSDSTSPTVAAALLNRRKSDAAAGKPVGPQTDRTTLDQLLGALLNDYRLHQRRSLARVEDACNHLREYFGGDCRAVALTHDRILSYTISRRNQDAAAPATCNRELAALRRALRLGHKAGLVSVVPPITMLSEDNVRQGFLEHDQFQALHTALPECLKDPVAFVYLSGWRRNEVMTLEWRDIERDGSMIRLRPEVSKNKDGRLLPVEGELVGIIERARARRLLSCPLIFHNAGRPLRDFRVAWRKACAAIGMSGLLLHDLRRCRVRILSRSGVPEKISMSLTGHKTRSIFDRYNITSEADLREAVLRAQEYLEGQAPVSKVVPLAGHRASK